jgi:hypothetical protein
MKNFFLALFLLSIPTSTHAATWAQFALGGEFQAVLMVSNKTAIQWNGVIKLYQGFNAKWAGTWAANGQDFTGQQGAALLLPPHGTFKVMITGDAITRSGYMDLDGTYPSSEYDISYSFFYEMRVNGDLKESVGGSDSVLSKKYVFAVERSAKVDTGYAWCPSSRYSTTPFFVVLTLYDQTGNVYDQQLVSCEGQQAIFFSQVFTDLPANFMGFLKVDSMEYMYMTVMRMEKNSTGVQYTCIPPDDWVGF